MLPAKCGATAVFVVQQSWLPGVITVESDFHMRLDSIHTNAIELTFLALDRL
ncbi:MAG: hypothetical protein GY759_16660 [Chloroflexi bacterium]|nr:hypothetical protein [Chloroflexota bacterium]